MLLCDSLPCGKSDLDLLSLVYNLAEFRLLQLRMEKEEMEEELVEKMEVLQRDLDLARVGARDTHQVEELKKVLSSWCAERQVGVSSCFTGALLPC